MNINVRTGQAAQLALDELVVANAFLSILQERIKENGHDVPGEISTEAREVEVALANKLSADRERRLRVLFLRRDSLLTRGDKLKAVDAEIASLTSDPQATAQVAK